MNLADYLDFSSQGDIGKFTTAGQRYEAESGKELLFHAGRQGCADVPEDVPRAELSETNSFDVAEANLSYLK